MAFCNGQNSCLAYQTNQIVLYRVNPTLTGKYGTFLSNFKEISYFLIPHHLKFFEYPYLLALLVSIQNGIFHDILKEKPIFMKLLKTLSR